MSARIKVDPAGWGKRHTGKGDPHLGEGTSSELALARDIAIEISHFYRGDVRDFFVAGPTHERLPPGSVSIAWEGAVNQWPVDWTASSRADVIAEGFKVWFEPINNCILAVHRND